MFNFQQIDNAIHDSGLFFSDVESFSTLEEPEQCAMLDALLSDSLKSEIMLDNDLSDIDGLIDVMTPILDDCINGWASH